MAHMLAIPGRERGRTVAVTPTVVRGPMEQSPGSERRADLMSRTAMPRFRGAEEVAAMVSWQCGPEFMFWAGILFDPSGDLVKPDQSRYELSLTLSVSPTTELAASATRDTKGLITLIMRNFPPGTPFQ